ncbi:unnamed protein product [marine sediment metagenome]|uniref:Uncharacterized protein n=1 Tax=marine sediment metagenome TaxID=412755 RepID=X0VH32_9ZZZZ
MAKTTEYRRKSKLPDALQALRGNTHFADFLEAMDVECGHGKTVYTSDPYQSAFNQGRQSFANDIHEAISRLEAESKPTTK